MPYWIEPNSDRIHLVKNLGWLINHRREVVELRVVRADADNPFEATMRALLSDGRTYVANFASMSVCIEFANARRFPNIQHMEVPL